MAEIYVFTPIAPADKLRESNKEMERLPSVGGVSSSRGCSPSWQRVRAGRLHQLRSDFPSLVGGREEEGARDSV